jgi:para-aminobenzoate synthetase/4-amino-4-deoxychorismate lyase
MLVLTQFKKTPLLFKNPLSLITTYDSSGLAGCFAQMEEALSNNYYLAGFLSYEAGYAAEKCFAPKKYDFPLCYMGVYKDCSNVLPWPKTDSSDSCLKNFHLNVTQEKYFSDIDLIRRHIACGNVYQITYCIKLLFDLCGCPWQIYNRLLQVQPVPYPAYIQTSDFSILSLSPEKFLKKNSRHIIAKPMKGTWQRGNTFSDDLIQRFKFSRDKKNQAENVMIADLLRNDLGRVGDNVRAPRLFEIAGYKTLFQMTSTVTASLEKKIPLEKLFGAIFPSGSVTGAPKIRAMEIIRQLETEERRIYTGAIGYITPKRDMFFNVPIRTLLIRNGHGEMGIGGGIVWDSTAQGEWDEGLLKARFVTSGAVLNFI